MSQPEPGVWTLISPSGKRFTADKPLKCVQVELNLRVPVMEQLRGIQSGLREDSPSFIKDHEIAALVNRLRDVAIAYHGAEQLRERIVREVLPIIRRANGQEP